MMSPKAGGHRNALHHPNFPDDFRDFIRELNAQQVEYLLVGGFAVGMYGHVRATADIDFLYRRTAENIGRLMRALECFGAPSEVIDLEHLAKPEGITAFGEPPNRIDLLASISGVSFEDACAHAVELRIEGDRLLVIGLDALRANKAASGRKKDLDDLQRLPLNQPLSPRSPALTAKTVAPPAPDDPA